MNINTFLESLADNSSRNFKIDQLSAHRDNETLREVVRLALDPFTQFYQRKIPKYKPNTNPLGDNLDWALDQLVTMLASRKVTGNAAIEHLQYVLENVTADNAKVVERVIQKDLKCGVQVSTANTVWANMVADYPCMLCSPFEEKLAKKIGFPAFVQLKMDGMRFNAIVKHTDVSTTVEFRSRNGKELQLLGNLEQEFIELAGTVDHVFDGELLVEDNGQIADRQTGNGILNKANKGTISQAEADKVCAAVWDMIPLADFQRGFSDVVYAARFHLLSSMDLPAKVRLVESTLVNSLEEAQAIFEDYLAKGQEGIILKDQQGKWENKRAKHQIKFKGELECDLKIVGIEEGSGKYAGMLGAILLESADGVLKVRAGSGFNDHQRQTLGEEIIGKIAAIKYNMRSVDKQGKQSLFLPIVLEIREDKTEADHSKDIK